MKKSLIFLLFSFLFFTACKREYALVQPAKPEFFEKKVRSKILTPERVTEKAVLVSKGVSDKESEVLFSEQTVEEVQTADIDKASFAMPEKWIIAKKPNSQTVQRQGVAIVAETTPTQELRETPKKQIKKKKRKRRARWNSMIPAGFVFLGIAILLAFLNLNGLALLFGVASILFLFLGFKRLFRKNRRRSIFR